MSRRAALVAAALAGALLVPAAPAQADHICSGRPATIHDDGDPTTPIDGTPNDDVIVGTAGPDVINALGGNDHVCAGGGDDEVYGGEGHDELYGDGGADLLFGDAGNDVVTGLAGDDDLYGGTGRDVVYYYDAPFSSGVLSVDLDLEREFDHAVTTNGTDQVDSIEVVYGSPYNDALRGDDNDNYLDGDPGDDIVEGRGGNDHVIGDNVNQPTPGNDTLDGGEGNDHIWGHDGDDIMTDPSGTNRFDGGRGTDTMTGGTGFDYLDYSCRAPAGPFCPAGTGALASGQFVDLLNGYAEPVIDDADATDDHGSDTFTGIEGVQGSRFRDELYGRDNVQDVEAFGDYFWPELGDDLVNGRGGPDYVDYTLVADDPDGSCATPAPADVGVTIIMPEGATAGSATGSHGTDELLNLEHAIGSAGDDHITGNSARNELWGGCGADVLNGRGGDDVIAGDEGNDIVRGQAGHDRLAGDEGDDAINGGAGSDLVSYDAFSSGGAAGVEVYLGAGTALGDGEDALAAIEIVLGSEHDDVVVGGGKRDILIGGGGTDELWGRGGADVLLGDGTPPRAGSRPDGGDLLVGGPGVDTADYSKAAARVVVDLGSRTGDEGGAGDHLSGIEVVQGSPFGDLLRGDAVANRLFGGAGRDRLLGRGGNDYLDGGLGWDDLDGGSGLFDVADFGHADAARLVLDLGAGTANVREPAAAGGRLRKETIAAVELVAGTPGNDVLRGSAATDYLAGEAGDDTIRGLGSGDFLFGGAGLDTIYGGAGKDVCHRETGETSVCEDPQAGTPTWHTRISGVRQFRNTGADDLLDNLDEIIEDLRRLHRRRLHR